MATPANDGPVLIADVPDLERILRDCFAEDDVVYASTFRDATEALRARTYRLVVIGLHFDHSSMFELLRVIRADPRFDEVPVVCIRALPTRLTDDARRGIRYAVEHLGAQAFVDIPSEPRAAKVICSGLARTYGQVAAPAAAQK